MGKSRRWNLAAAAFDDNNMSDDQRADHDHSKKKKLMIHRENERQRRQEMGTLHASLRSLLPLEFIKGKRSISDHMNEAVNYIKHLRIRIKRLDAKRAELKRLSRTSTSTSNDHGGESSPICSCFTVHPYCGGLVQIVVSSTSTSNGFGSIEDNGLSASAFSISRVLEVLIEQGMSVVSCVSAKVNEKILHTIQCEVDDVETSMNLSGLEQKLSQVFPSSSRCVTQQ